MHDAFECVFALVDDIFVDQPDAIGSFLDGFRRGLVALNGNVFVVIAVAHTEPIVIAQEQ